MLSKIYLNGVLLETISFSGGEVQILIPEKSFFYSKNEHLNIVTAHLKCNSGLIALGQLKDLLRHNFGSLPIIRLELPYVPYGRYDRRMLPVDSHSLKVFCTILNSFNFDEIVIEDAHSSVAEALLNNAHPVSQLSVLKDLLESKNPILDMDKYCSLVSPDNGASKKTEEVMLFFNKGLVKCDKKRDKVTREILGFSVLDSSEPIEGSNLLILDDICDGGRTFLGLSKELKNQGAKSVDLYVTHGIFSRGVEHLLKDIDNIYCKYSWLECPKIKHQRLY